MLIMIRGGGDLASGVALRLIRSGLRVVVTELPQPLAVRRTVSFAEAVYSREITIEEVPAQLVEDPGDTLRILTIFGKQKVPVLVDPECTSAKALHPSVIIDGRMIKRPPEPIGYIPRLYLGLGPGFIAGENCQAVVETRRGPSLGRVFWTGGPEEDTGQPEGDPRRVFRAPAAGEFRAVVNIGDHVAEGQRFAEVGGKYLAAPFPGVIRGLIHPGLRVTEGMKVGDIDARDDPQLCRMVSDKALSVGGGVLEAILSRPDLRLQMWA